jgi:hypothetical protein
VMVIIHPPANHLLEENFNEIEFIQSN